MELRTSTESDSPMCPQAYEGQTKKSTTKRKKHVFILCKLQMHVPSTATDAEAYPLRICNWGNAGCNAATNQLPQVCVLYPLLGCHAKYCIHGGDRCKLVSEAREDKGGC